MKNWQRVCLKRDNTISEAIKVLDREALQIILVVSDKDTLLGTITDGDIRRALTHSYSLEIRLDEVMNKNPTVASVNDEREKILTMMQDQALLHIPLVNSDGHLAGLETLKHLTEQPRYDNSVFLMAGGFGKRLRPLTLDIPKPLLKVGTKPILETILEQFAESGFHNFYISTHYKAEMVREYFGTGEQWNVSIQYVYENEPRGTAGALGLLPEDLPNLPVIVMNGDLMTKVNFENLLNFHQEHGNTATMCVREFDFQVPYGVVKTDGKSITSIVEKPVHSFFVNAGIYVLNMDLIRTVDGAKYIDMPDLLEQSIENGEKISMFPIHEFWLDIGNLPDYNRANNQVEFFK